jgi:hypothetical protein
MKIEGKVHCFFEQSGTFKNEFKKLGYEAYDYDIQNNFGETDHVIDLFAEIETAYNGGGNTVFDKMTKDDLIIAFFPCIKFCNIAEYNQRIAQEAWRKHGMDIHRIYELLKKHSDERYFFYQKALKLHGCVEFRGLRMVMENPWHETNYTNYFWFMRPQIIDMDRTKRGDWFKKPTAYWFTNCEPTHGCSYQQTPEKDIRRVGMTSAWKNPDPNKKYAKGSGKKGLCSEERSLISPDYARNWICDFILGQDQHLEPSLFDSLL